MSYIEFSNVSKQFMDGDIKVNELNGMKIICNTIADCYKLESQTIECTGNITAANVSCDHIVYNK